MKRADDWHFRQSPGPTKPYSVRENNYIQCASQVRTRADDAGRRIAQHAVADVRQRDHGQLVVPPLPGVVQRAGQQERIE